MSDTPQVFQDEERLDLPSASAMEIIQACPGQPNLKRTLPPEAFVSTETQDEWAERGTRIHLAFETGNTLPLNPEETRIYQEGVNHERLLVQQWIHDKALDPSKVREGPRELRVWLHDPIHFPKLMGSAKLDRHYVYRDPERTALLVLDLKTGWNPNLPTPRNSWQLKYQLTGLWKEEYDNVTDGRVAFVKPKDKVGPEDYCDYDMMDLKYSYDALIYHHWFSTQEDAPRHPGSHCRWCPARNGYCVEALAYSLLPSVIAKNVFKKDQVAAAVNEVTGDDLLKIWRAGSTIKNIIDGVSTRLKGLSEAELIDLGLKLGPGATVHEITAIEECMGYLQETQGWSKQEVFACMAFVGKSLKEQLERKHGLDDKKAGVWIRETLQQFITTKENAKVLRTI